MRFPGAQTLESTYNTLDSVTQFPSSTIAGIASDEGFNRYSRWRINSTTQGAAGEFFKWDSLSNLRQGYTQELLYNAEANRLTQVRDIAAPQTVRHTYSYDAAGFVTNRDGVTLGYDATGALASIGSVAAFDHDLRRRPVSRTLDGITKVFRFGGAIAYNTSGSPIEMDLGEVVLRFDGTGTRYRHVDFRGNVLFVSNGTGTVDGQATYRGFGRRSASGTLGERGFAQGFEVPSLGLVVLGPRVLDSDTGRFLSQDPVFNAVNQYAYAQGNPVLMWDPTGLHPVGALVGFSFGSFGFSIDGFSTGGGPPPGSAPGFSGDLRSERQSQRDAERLADKQGRILVGAFLIANGSEMIAVGFEAATAGVVLAPVTDGVSLLGTVGGIGIVGIGAFEVGAGIYIVTGAGAAP